MLDNIRIQIHCALTDALQASKTVVRPHAIIRLNPHALKLMDASNLSQERVNVKYISTNTETCVKVLDPYFW